MFKQIAALLRPRPVETVAVVDSAEPKRKPTVKKATTRKVAAKVTKPAAKTAAKKPAAKKTVAKKRG